MLMTLPRRSAGTVMCSTELVVVMNRIWHPPTHTSDSSDSGRVRIWANRMRATPWNSRAATSSWPGRPTRWAKRATPSMASNAPSPGAAIINPRPSGPTPSTSFWKIGIRVWYGIAKMRGTRAAVMMAKATGSDHTYRNPSRRFWSTEERVVSLATEGTRIR